MLIERMHVDLDCGVGKHLRPQHTAYLYPPTPVIFLLRFCFLSFFLSLFPSKRIVHIPAPSTVQLTRFQRSQEPGNFSHEDCVIYLLRSRDSAGIHNDQGRISSYSQT